MSDIQKAIDLIDEIDVMPFGKVAAALDRVQVHLTTARRKYEPEPSALRPLTPERHNGSHRRVS
ncbi:hypothetical protein [Tardiphaga sp.]|uniref:hypothetical protein n=1 Tax=Tardiphaga sp. TaxID=1926292 RepID=UPI00260FD219|nr:hypothetical protein [Tardiphaga sp.]MDB5618539.1 hypothetical protein [Tardiphaga sp.]